MTSGQAALLRKAKRNLKAAQVLMEKRYYDIAVSRARSGHGQGACNLLRSNRRRSQPPKEAVE